MPVDDGEPVVLDEWAVTLYGAEGLSQEVAERLRSRASETLKRCIRCATEELQGSGTCWLDGP